MAVRRFLSTLVLVLACAPTETEWPEDAQAVSLLGDTLYTPPLTADVAADRKGQLLAAQSAYEANPDDPDALIWLGRRTAYLGQYREAIDIFSDGVERFPDDARILRHRGHRYITTRQIPLAIADLSAAADMIRGTEDEVEPDGQPNALGIPTSTLHTNTYYHLGLAHYLDYDYDAALDAYRACLEAAANDDMRIATLYWAYLTLGMLGERDEADELLTKVTSEMDIIENHSYHRLLRLFKGELTIEDVTGDGEDALASATTGYGVAMMDVLEGTEDAAAALRRVTSGSEWAAFGYVAAESLLADLSRR